MKFRNDSPEEMCMAETAKNKRKYPCSRRLGHKGRHMPNETEAAEADGVYACCRNSNQGNHKEECYQPALAPPTLRAPRTNNQALSEENTIERVARQVREELTAQIQSDIIESADHYSGTWETLPTSDE